MSNSKRKCGYCHEYFSPEPGQIFPRTTAWCCDEHGYLLARKRLPKQKAKKEKEERQKTRKELAELNRKSISWQHKQAQKAFNRMRVLQEIKWYRDRGLVPECISCESKTAKFTCGHYKTMGHAPGLRYKPWNTYLQCWWNCNYNKSGNINGTQKDRGMIKGILDRFGEEDGQRRLDYCNSFNETVKWDCDELEKFRAQCNKEIRRLEKLLDL